MKIFILFLPAMLVFLSCCNDKSTLQITDLKCEYLVNPLGLDEPNPRFSWQFSAIENNKQQRAFRILIGLSEKSLLNNKGDIWDSGKANSNLSTNLSFNGLPLQSFTRYYWKIMVWDEKGNPTAWSKMAYFETAMLEQADWISQWIGDGRITPDKDEDFYKEIPAPLFRKTFELDDQIESARLYVSGLGYYEAYINGKKVGDHVLDPGWTNYGKRVLYETYDVTGKLKNGENVIGLLVGNGWYNPLPLGLFRKINLRKYLTVDKPKAIAQMRIEYSNGEVETIVSDDSWKTHDSYILKNDVFLGEMQDANKQIENWCKPDYNDNEWLTASIESEPGGRLKAQMTPPVKITGHLKPIRLTDPRKGVYVYDLGQNFAGWIRFNVRSDKGKKIKFLYGELLNEDGSVNGMSSVAGQIKEIWNLSGGPGAPKTAFQIDEFISSGSKKDVFQQHFTFHAFRYVEISGLGYEPELEDLEGLRLSASLERIGNFNCSNDLFNQIQDVIDWTFLSNVFSVQSDCPGREKQGYGADIVTSAEAFIYNYDMANFYRKMVNDFVNDVRPNGGMPECAPYNGIETKGFGEGTGPVGWQLAFPYVQKLLYTFYGDVKIIEENYDYTKGMVDFLRSQSVDNLIYHGISDHVSVDPKPEALTSGALYYHNVILLEEFAGILNKSDDVDIYKRLAEDIKTAFIDRYLKPGTGKFDSLTTQITQVFALYYNLIPDEEKDLAFDELIHEILKTHEGHLSTGIFGTKMLFDVLRLENRNDIAYQVASQSDFPGYGYMLSKGATTLWEHWDFQEQNSQNHPMFGSVSEWYFRSLAGINPASDAFGFNKVIIKPFIVGDLEYVNGEYNSIKGKIFCNWQHSEGSVNIQVQIPPNVSATLFIPALSEKDITVNGISALSNQEIKFLDFQDSFAVFETGNGTFNINTLINN